MGEISPTAHLRRFGFAFGGGLSVLGGLLTWKERGAGPWVLGAAATVLVLAAVAPRVLTPLEWLLSRVFQLVTQLLTWVLMTLTFFLVVTPIGLLIRAFGRDPLGRRPDPEASSYWVDVPPDGPGSRPEKPF